MALIESASFVIITLLKGSNFLNSVHSFANIQKNVSIFPSKLLVMGSIWSSQSRPLLLSSAVVSAIIFLISSLEVGKTAVVNNVHVTKLCILLAALHQSHSDSQLLFLPFSCSGLKALLIIMFKRDGLSFPPCLIDLSKGSPLTLVSWKQMSFLPPICSLKIAPASIGVMSISFMIKLKLSRETLSIA